MPFTTPLERLVSVHFRLNLVTDCWLPATGSTGAVSIASFLVRYDLWVHWYPLATDLTYGMAKSYSMLWGSCVNYVVKQQLHSISIALYITFE